jgi:hypothetical protein
MAVTSKNKHYFHICLIIFTVVPYYIVYNQKLGDDLFLLHYITLCCIALHSLDSRLIRMTVGCEICHVNTKLTVQLKFSHKKTQWLHIRIFKNTSTYVQGLDKIMEALEVLYTFLY